MTVPPSWLFITSRHNALYQSLCKHAHDSAHYRKERSIFVEGDHLIRAAIDKGLSPTLIIMDETASDALKNQWQIGSRKNILLAAALIRDLSLLGSPTKLCAVFDLPDAPTLQDGVSTVILDRLQDAGNVGTIMRCAAAFGFTQLVAMKGTCALWSPKVLRAAMGAHFGLRLVELATLDDISLLRMPIYLTSSHHGAPISQILFPPAMAWIFGHEGQGVGEAMAKLATDSISIPQPGGQESLNVASAAAICLFMSRALA